MRIIAVRMLQPAMAHGSQAHHTPGLWALGCSLSLQHGQRIMGIPSTSALLFVHLSTLKDERTTTAAKSGTLLPAYRQLAKPLSGRRWHTIVSWPCVPRRYLHPQSAISAATAGAVVGPSALCRMARGLAGKPLAGFCTTPSRRITVVYGVIVYAIRFKTPSLHR